MNEHAQWIWSEHLLLALWGAAPLVGILLFLLCALLVLRRRSRKKSNRMSRAECEMTGIGATTWESYQGPATMGPPTVDSVVEKHES